MPCPRRSIGPTRRHGRDSTRRRRGSTGACSNASSAATTARRSRRSGAIYRSAAAVGNAPALEIWADASFANELYHGSTLLAKSRTGLLVLAFGALLYATSVRQTAVALSTCEAETSAHALATRVAIPIRLTLVALQCYRLPRPVAIHCDNTAVLALIKRRHVNSRLRHYRVNIAFVFHAIELGLTTVRYCKTAHMRADFLTKALPVGAFRANAALVYPDYEYAPL